MTIVPRDCSLGVTMQTPIDERHNYTREYLIDRLAVMLGGRAAEKVTYDSISTGAENDLMQCTILARNMVARYGMSEKLGNISLLDNSGESYIGDSPFGQRNFSEATLHLVDAETKQLIDDACQRALTLISEHKHKLDLITDALMVTEIIDGAQLTALIETGDLPNAALEDSTA